MLFDNLLTDDVQQCQFICVFNSHGDLGKMWCSRRQLKDKGDNSRHHDGIFSCQALSLYVFQNNPRASLLLLSILKRDMSIQNQPQNRF